MESNSVEIYLNGAAILIAGIALGVSFLSWRTSVRATRASIYDRRFEVYSDAEKFLSAWMRDGKPDMTMLGTLVGAWSRSQFLCSKEVTQYLRDLWTDAVKAQEFSLVISGEADGDRQVAVAKFYDILRRHADFDRLREKFKPDLRV